MTDETDSADDERSLFAKILRRSADELEQPDDGETDGDPDVESRADDDDEDDDDVEQEANPIYSALEAGDIDAQTAERLRELTDGADTDEVKLVVDKVAEGDLDEDEAAVLLGASPGDDEMADPEDEAPEELRSGDDDDGTDDPSDDAPEEAFERLESKLDEALELGDRLDDIEQRLDDLPTADDVEEQVEQRLEQVGEDLDEEFEDLIQRAEIVGSPTPKSGETKDGPSLSESLAPMRGDS